MDLGAGIASQGIQRTQLWHVIYVACDTQGNVVYGVYDLCHVRHPVNAHLGASGSALGARRASFWATFDTEP